MHHLETAEFYITNVCNLTCQNCNRFNNFRFRGWQDWKDYKEDYQAWSKIFNFDNGVIIGGEPLLNPSLISWMQGLRELWPNANFRIATNGTRLLDVKGLYQACQDYNFWIELSLHDESHRPKLDSIVKQFLQDPKIEPYDWGLRYKDDNKVVVIIYSQTDFYSSAIVLAQDNTYRVYNSNPEQAHENCNQKNSHQFIRGKLYKCGPSALFKDFDQQYQLNINEEDRELIGSYRPLSATDPESLRNEFFENLKNPIAQCKFCPAQPITKTIILPPFWPKSL